MKENEIIKTKIIKSDWISCVYNLEEILLLANTLMFDRTNEILSLENERLNISNLLVKKVLLHGSTISINLKNLSYPIKNYSERNIFYPISLNVILRSLLECYLTMNHINFAETEEEKEIRFKIWSQYGLRQRKKMTFSILKSEGRSVQENDEKEIHELVNQIKNSIIYQNIDEDKRETFLNQISKDWKFGFRGKTYIKYSWKELLDKSGINKECSIDLYNYLSWFSHSSSISIYQLRDLYKDSGEMVELIIKNGIRETALLIALTITDLIEVNPKLKQKFNILTQKDKDLINTYNLFFRNESYTIN